MTRLRAVSENFTNSRRLEPLRSSWEIPKQNYGHLRASPSPNRQCSSTPGSSRNHTMQKTFRVDGTTLDQQNKTFTAIKDFVDYFAEDPSKVRYIKKILVATNGIAAVKCILSMRKLLMQIFREDRIVKFICLTTEQEIQSKAEYLKMADYIVFSPAGANTNNYANVDEIVEHAVRNEVDAVWAGWGHASENPRLPEELSRSGISFIGPPSKAMYALGDKIASTIIAQTVGIPTIEWSGSGLVAPEMGPEDAEFDLQDLFQQACVEDVEQGMEALRQKNIAYPVMIKASEGGGGKGIRRCNNDEEFRLNFRRVQAEVPGSPIFLMKCMENARHIEVQLIADQYGNVIPIFTRDCSIQRRCQKIIEEAPAGIAPTHILAQMQQDAVNLAKRVGYVSAGTVEYMYLPATQQYYFLELNPRLQVEHPCTEMISNINIPAVQLQVAMGIPLHRIVEIRLFFGLDRYGQTPLPDNQVRTDTNICVIAARITSEDPAEGFRPASGSVEVLNFQSNQNVWGYFSVASAGKVHEYADSQFGHLFARGTTRHEAISALMCALKELELRATFTCQVNYLVGLLHDPDFEQNRFHTGWLDSRIAAKVQSTPELPTHVTIAIGATVIGHARISEVFSKFQNAIDRGQILPTSELTETWEVELVYNNRKYSVLVNRYGPISFLVCLGNNKISTEVRELGNGTLLVTYSDQSYTCYLEEETERFKVSIGRTMTVFEKENDPSVLRSRNAGRLLQYLKKDGEIVSVGDVYAEMESMKMVINLEVKKAGGKLVSVARPGQVLFPGTLIARLVEQGDMSSAKPTDFKGTIEEWQHAEETKEKADVRLNLKYESLIQRCKDILSGYAVPVTIFKSHLKKLVDETFNVLNDKKLPFSLFKVMLNVVQSRLAPSTYKEIMELLKSEDFPARSLTDTIMAFVCRQSPSEQQHFEALLAICERFHDGLEGHQRIVVNDLLENFLDIERYFQDVSYDKGVSTIKSQVADSQKVVRMVYSHTQIVCKNALLKEILSRLSKSLIIYTQPMLKRIANLFNAETEPLALFVRQMLNEMHQISYGDVCTNLSRKSSQRSLNDLVALCSADKGDRFFKECTNDGFSNNPLVLHEFFFTANKETNSHAIKTFIERTFYVDKNDITTIVDKNATKTDMLVFKFEIEQTNPLYAHAVKGMSKNHNSVMYFLSVLSQLDLLKQKKIVELLKQNVTPNAKNNYLFVSFSKGENGFSTASTWPEAKLRQLGRELRQTVADQLEKSGITAEGVDLMLSRPSHAPVYTEFDFSTKEKLELYRLPAGAQNVSVAQSPYLLFKHNDNGVTRIFVRRLLRDMAATIKAEKFTSPVELLTEKMVEVIDGACGEIRVCTATDKKATFDCHHVLVCLDYEPEISTANWWKAIQEAVKKCEKYLTKHRITQLEITYHNTKSNGTQTNGITNLDTIRVLYVNETGAIPDFAVYRVIDGKLQPLNSGQCRYAGETCYAPHPSIAQVHVQLKRYQAHKLGTTYVYDFPIVFARAALDLWKTYETTDPQSYKTLFNSLSEERRTALQNYDARKFAKAWEMLLDDTTGEIHVCREESELKRRAAGHNDRGMIAWEMELCTPDAPQGRTIVVIANDITYQMGSFSMREHHVYHKASEYSRQHGMPRIYLAANSGARIGFASDIKKRLNVVWNDETRPEDGYRHLSVDCEGASDPILDQVVATECDGRMRLDAVIGKEDDIGVENLVGSGLIAGETTAAYKEVPTYCLVTGRAVGIGAYAARLAHRVCQVENSHIILTGAAALNSVLGREIYTSNGQLGGPQIMFHNGVSHSVVQTDLEGVSTILNWISYLPQNHIVTPMKKDDQGRHVETMPTRAAYDPRTVMDPLEGGGLFDKGTFDEIMSGWAKTIIAGRARLRGLPVGVIAVETRTVECQIPADPAAQDSQSRVVQQAGQVWYPDSAYKTAEAINDFNREGLPLVMLANIRGFSGGQKDMYEMVLKFGACIVDALQAYTQPVIVYIPPYGELRGGAWAVLDTKINSTCITMLADPDSRGGVLEPEGIVEIKFRQRDLQPFMTKCDVKLRQLEGVLRNESLDQSERDKAQKEIDARREFLTPVFRTVAVKFADLHDTTPRMLAKGAIHDEVPWQNSRNYIYELLSTQLAKFEMARQYLSATGVDIAHLRIDQLTEGCQWVERHLQNANITYRASVTENASNRRRRYEYDANVISQYARSDEFKRVTEEIEVERITRLIIEKSKLMSEETRKRMIQQLVNPISKS